MGKGLLPDTRELAATGAKSLTIGKCDVALELGARLNWLLHLGKPPNEEAKENVSRMEAQLAKDVRPFNFMTPMRIIRDAILVSKGANTINVGRVVLIQTEPRSRLDVETWGTMEMV
ncbi:unnamed protein product [Ilex paraguariensis]|uniref:Uncharacterized protein n=1 Tax=Ilex paraguariensis TaxID=185542 RepID=A0ABC8S867_9AQUA